MKFYLILQAIRRWLMRPMQPCPKDHLFILRWDGRVIMKVTFEMLMMMNNSQGRDIFEIVLSKDGHIVVSDSLAWPGHDNG